MLIALVPLSSFALMDSAERNQAAQALDRALEKAAGSYRSRPRLSESKVDASMTQEEITKAEEAVRLQIVAYEDAARQLEDRFGMILEPLHAAGGPSGIRSDAHKVVFENYQGELSQGILEEGNSKNILGAFDVLSGMNVRSRTINQSQNKLHELIALSGEGARELDGLKKKHKELLALKEGSEESSAVKDSSGDKISDERREAVKRNFEEVHAQVLRMQSELARIDARMRSKAERKLIEKGLIAPKPGEHSNAVLPFTPSFTWPAYGRISAEFMQASYLKYFGIPHKGMDIAIPQGSPIVAAADGVVFLARDGGAKGYSYVLIGHRGGHATLYGHLSSIAVTAGSDISAGQTIGMSGGQPGTHGAGPTTTGHHLHFEVIVGGVNVNPRGVLP